MASSPTTRAGPAETAELVCSRIERFIEEPSQVGFDELYASAVNASALGYLGYADALIDLLEGQAPDQDRLVRLGRVLAGRGRKREAVKLGLVLLAVAGADEDLPLLRTLGGHDEFTLFASVEISRIADDPRRELWKLARRVHGWGRVHLVERLAGNDDPAFREWLFRDGYRNTVMDQHLALIAAQAGDLAGRLAGDWTPAVRSKLMQMCDAILRGPHWEVVIRSDLGSPDRRTRLRGLDGADALGLADLELHADLIRRSDDVDPYPWSRASFRIAPEEARRFVALAEEELPLEDIATGPGMEPGLGPGSSAHQALDAVLQYLLCETDDRGYGWDLIRAGLRSSTLRNRAQACALLASTPRDLWRADLVGVVRVAADREPDEVIAERLRGLMST